MRFKYNFHHQQSRIVVIKQTEPVLCSAVGLFAALSSHNPRWGFYGASCFFEVCIGYGLLVPGIKHAYLRGKGIGSFYTGLSLLLFITWWGYPIVWGFAEGSNFISVDAEVGTSLLQFLTRGLGACLCSL